MSVLALLGFWHLHSYTRPLVLAWNSRSALSFLSWLWYDLSAEMTWKRSILDRLYDGKLVWTGIRFPDAVWLQIANVCVLYVGIICFDSINDRFQAQHLGVRVICSILLMHLSDLQSTHHRYGLTCNPNKSTSIHPTVR